jgi:hypothetical protein
MHTQTLNIHALCGIRTHDPGFRASEDSACLRLLCYRDRPLIDLILWNFLQEYVLYDIEWDEKKTQ